MDKVLHIHFGHSCGKCGSDRALALHPARFERCASTQNQRQAVQCFLVANIQMRRKVLHDTPLQKSDEIKLSSKMGNISDEAV